MSQMDAKQAASLIEKWIAFYDMDNPEAWDRDDYKFVQQSCRTMRAAIQMLRGKSVPDQRKLADGLEEFIEDSFMDDPHEWEPENRTFVKQAMEALQYTAAQLRKSFSTGTKPATGAPQQRGNKGQHSKSAAGSTNASKSATIKAITTKGGTSKPSNAKTVSNQSTGNKTARNQNSTNPNRPNKTSNNNTNKTSAAKSNPTRSTSSNRNDRDGGRGKNGGR
ncbi:hypothetical protein [Paenibacillus wenxiniae]|uniref:Uncharacterized protein n=1 Tax=Paenibacillus wenxiniae TaxID=1636843 RepID=A0ABW4RGV7_9BACL